MFDRFGVSVALYKPEIPSNTGNIGRLCVGLNAVLHIVGKPSFMMRDKELKRAGLDYWEHLTCLQHKTEEDFLDYCTQNTKTITTVSKFASRRYDAFEYNNDSVLLFGRESKGLSGSLWDTDINKENGIYIPMSEKIRSINLSNSVAIVLYEAARHIVFQNI